MKLPLPSSLSFHLSGGRILTRAQVMRDGEAGPGAGVAVAVLASRSGLGNIFHSPMRVCQAGEELRFPVLWTNK